MEIERATPTLIRSISHFKNIKSLPYNDSRQTEPQLRGNFVLRQELNSYTPECNTKCGIIFNLFLMIFFLAAGVPILVSSHQSEEYYFNYTNWYRYPIKI